MLETFDRSQTLLLLEKIRRAEHVEGKLFHAAVSAICPRRAIPKGRMEHVGRLVVAEAWVDAALALMALALPGWTLRRIERDDNEWNIVLTKGGQWPIWLGVGVEAHHAELPLAMLEAVLEARADSGRWVPQAHNDAPPSAGETVCCDDFL